MKAKTAAIAPGVWTALIVDGKDLVHVLNHSGKQITLSYKAPDTTTTTTKEARYER